MARSRNIYRPGTGAYDAARAAELRRQRRQAKQALTSVKRAKDPEGIRKAKRRAARIERELVKVTARQEVRAGLSEAIAMSSTASASEDKTGSCPVCKSIPTIATACCRF